MKTPGVIALLFVGLFSSTSGKTHAQPKATVVNGKSKSKFRVIISSDFPPTGVLKSGDHVPDNMKSDPDDLQSMVRFLLYANEFDIEGLIASAGTFAMTAEKKNILEVLDQYEKVFPNLSTYDSGYPTANFLRSVTFEGKGNNNGLNIKWGCNKQPYTSLVGKGLDSEASNAIISATDKPDSRPLWIAVWGGPREVAQAIWHVKNTRSKKAFKTFIAKLRIFLIGCQDATHDWLMNEFPDLFIIESKTTYTGMFDKQDAVSNLAWVNENIRNGHGPLCAIYPQEGVGSTGVCEGDSPSFLHLVSANRGVNKPENPTLPGWGGQYVKMGETNHYIDGPGAATIRRWRNDYQHEFKERADWCIKAKNNSGFAKPRIINTTDLGADPDDEQSMVRQLVSANEFDIEGLIVTTSCWKKTQKNTAILDRILDAYGKAYPNLTVHANGYPSPEYLKSIAVMGQTNYGMSAVGSGKDSKGSNRIIEAVDKDDLRPLWVMGWGGMNTVAQAIWKVNEHRSAAGVKKFLQKLRLIDILGQDDAGAWIAKNFPDVFYIRATGVYGWAPSDQYIDTCIQNHGPLGAVYPDRQWATEGDSPAFLHVFPNGLNDPEKIDQGGWGGRFSFEKKQGIRSMSEVAKINPLSESQFDPYYMYGNTAEADNAIKKWSQGYNNDFAARMDWAIKSNYKLANHHPVAVLNGDNSRLVLEIAADPGTQCRLSAEGSSDPDGNKLSYNWFYYAEPGTYEGLVTIKNSMSDNCIVEIPVNSSGKTVHVILEVSDNGSPGLITYRRAVIHVK